MCQYKEVCFKVMLEKSPLKIYYFLRGLLLNLHSSEGGTTIYAGCGIRKEKKPMNGDGGGGIRGENFKITLFHSSVKEQLEP